MGKKMALHCSKVHAAAAAIASQLWLHQVQRADSSSLPGCVRFGNRQHHTALAVVLVHNPGEMRKDWRTKPPRTVGFCWSVVAFRFYMLEDPGLETFLPPCGRFALRPAGFTLLLHPLGAAAPATQNQTPYGSA